MRVSLRAEPAWHPVPRFGILQQVVMKGTIIGVSIFLVLAVSVSFAAVGAVTQVSSDSVSPGVGALAVAEYGNFPGKAEQEKQPGVYQAFTYVCPFH